MFFSSTRLEEFSRALLEFTYSFRPPRPLPPPAHVGGRGLNMWVWPTGSGVRFKAVALRWGVWLKAVGLAYWLERVWLKAVGVAHHPGGFAQRSGRGPHWG